MYARLLKLILILFCSICFAENDIAANIEKIGQLRVPKPDVINSIVDIDQVIKPDKIKELPIITVDKSKGTISVYFPDTKETRVGYALTGRTVSNTLDMDVYNNPNKRANHITPTGEFTLTKLFSWRLNEPMIAFIRGSDKIASIHPLWMGNPDQKRVQRLISPTPDDNHITNGCINTDPVFFYDVIDKVPTGSKLIILPN